MAKQPSLQQAVLKNANSACLNGRPLQSDLETALQRSVKLANDADCFALSEATDSAAVGATAVFGVILGTGTEGGVVVHGQLLKGATIHYPGLSQKNCQAQPVIAESRAVLRPFFQGQAWQMTMPYQ